jgi:pimeloyl-ACP methyl ester carboxylesterase
LLPTELTVDARGRATRLLRGGDGSGAPLVWLHDTLGNVWTVAHERLGATRTVLSPSLPGFDDSSTLGGIDGPEDVVFWLLDLLDALQLERVAVLGCGLGGWIAAEFAVRYPQRVERLVLVDAYGLRVPGSLAADEFALTPAMLRPLLFADADSDLALATTPDVQPTEGVEAALHARVAGARLAWQFPYDRKLGDRLRRATMPGLVVWGERDRLVPLAHARAYADGLPDARLTTLKGAGHYPYIESPNAFVGEVAAFLRADSP